MKGPMKIKTSVLFKEIAVDSKLHVLIGNEGPSNQTCLSMCHIADPSHWTELVNSWSGKKKNWKSIHKHQRNEPSKFRSSETSEASETNKTRFIRRERSQPSKALLLLQPILKQQLSSNNCHHLSIIFHHLQSWSRHRGACSIRQAGQTGEESRRKETAVPTFFTCIKLPSPIAGDTFELRSRGVIPTLSSSSS